MPSQPPSSIEIEFVERYSLEHARVCGDVRPRGVFRRLIMWRQKSLVRLALNVAGEPGLVLDVACGAGQFWPVLAERDNRVILATDPSQTMLEHAKTHYSAGLLSRIILFKSSVFAIDLPENSVDSIFCMQLFHHVRDSEHRLAILRELHRVSRDTLIMSVCLGHSPESARVTVGREEIKSQLSLAGFSILKQYDVLPGCALSSVYIVRKVA